MVITYAQEKALVSTLLHSFGMPVEDAEIAGDVITYSDFTGVESHGLSRATFFFRQLSEGFMNPASEMEKLVDTPSITAYDCHNGTGLVSLVKAYKDLSIKAKENGIAIATGKRSANIGCGAYYTAQASKDKLIMILCSNTYLLQAPYGGADRLLGSNPIIISFPAKDHYPIALDMATCYASWGKVISARRKGQEIPSNWGFDKDGLPTTDPNKVYSLQPIATYKGYGLAVMIDLLSGVLADANYGTKMGDRTLNQPEGSGWMMILIDPSKFMPLEKFESNVDEYVDMIKNSRKAKGVDEIYVPGELEQKAFKNRMETGFTVNPNLENEVLKYAVIAGLCKEGDTLETLIASL